MINETHDPGRMSWVPSANHHPEFPIQNLPLGVFSPPGGAARGGIAIGDAILDLGRALEMGVFSGSARDAAELASGRTLNAFLGAGPAAHQALRLAVSRLLAADAPASVRGAGMRLLHNAADCALHMPAQVGDFTDFFAGIHHATAGGRINRPENPLMPNYKYVPVAYHSRASSVRVSGEAVRRPKGQRKLPEQDAPDFGPSRAFDHELEFGVWVGEGNDLGTPIPIQEAGRHAVGFCLLNDWSARDIQSWESAPLGPFLAKSASTSISPWIVMADALAPFRVPQPPRPAGDPAPLPHLMDAADQAHGAFDIRFEVLLQSQAMRASGLAPMVICRSNAQDLYWTIAQMVAHHASNGCNLRPGDLFGTGTVSGTEPGSEGCLLEKTRGGREPFTLPNGEVRRYLEDGDEVTFLGHASRPGAITIGFGACRGQVLPAD